VTEVIVDIGNKQTLALFETIIQHWQYQISALATPPDRSTTLARLFSWSKGHLVGSALYSSSSVTLEETLGRMRSQNRILSLASVRSPTLEHLLSLWLT